MNYKNIKLNWSRLLRRGTALALAFAMVLPTVAYGASAPLSAPAQVKVDSEFPNIEIQTNFVRSEYGTLEGTMELTLRVGPSGMTTVADPNNPDETVEEAIPVAFRTLSVNLQYDASLYTPISWSWIGGADTATDLELDADKAYTVDIPAKKNDLLPATGAIAKCGMTTSADGTKSGEGLVYFKAEAYNSDIILNEMTTLAAIRFKINEPLASKISILPDGRHGYTVYIDQGENVDPMVVTNIDELHAALGRDLTTDPASVGFASEEDIHGTRPPVDMALHYTGAKGQQMYYVPGCLVTDAAGALPSTVENVTVTIDGQDVTLAAPRTINGKVLAVDKNGATPTDKYSYLSNHFDDRPATVDGEEAHRHITWPVVSDVSFAYVPVDLSKYTTVVYVDWDNTLLGTQILPKRADVREMVNTYVAEHFVTEELRAPGAAGSGAGSVDSLTRADSYRGKYPTTPQALGPNGNIIDDGTVKPDGENYPLTNKLDYVFFKRPMECTESDSGTMVWSQKADESGNAIWDAEYPYAYGWAKCTVDNYADTWTTLGMGELSDYNGSNGGGYQQLASGEKASFTYDLAGFEFEMMDLEAGFKSTDNTVFLKAVYEPGEELQTTDNPYRMISEPYYNKLNKVSSADGGAWSVDVTFERSSEKNLDDPDDTRVRGVARLREPVVRQDTTADLLWETFTKDGEVKVDHDLPNANLESTYKNKDKSMFAKIDVSNTEEIPFSLTLTGRQNRADYYLKDAFGYNFVAGGDRIEGDANRSGTAATMDNYNYLVDGENESGPVYAAVPYAAREGSRGFVLEGTLNQLLELSTKVYNGELAAAEFITYLDVGVFNDINIKGADGSDPDPFTNLADLQQAIQDVGKDIVIGHQGDPDFWDNVHDCAQLSYHQLQLYIMGRGLLSRAAADAVIISHCHLHTNCVASVSNKPTNWGELIDAARNNPDHITELTGTEAENLTHLRRDGNGTAYGADVTAFKNDVVAAVAALDAANGAVTHSWDAVQAQILGETAADAREKYWWYDGSTSVPMNSWTDMMTAAKDSITPVALPDGSSDTRDAKLNRLEPTWAANDSAETTDRGWVRITENLAQTVNGEEGQKFATFADFKTALKGALTGLPQGTAATWYEIQYYILHHSDPAGDPNASTEYGTYWWHNGRVQIKSFAELMQAVSMAYQGDPTAMSDFSLDDLYNENYAEFHFRKTFDGTKYSDIEDFKRDMLAYYGAENGTASWVRAQYYIIHRSLGSNTVINREGAYFWWQGNGEPEAVDFALTQDDPAARADALAVALMDAAFRATYNGNTKAWDNLDADFASVLEQGRLVSADPGGAEHYPADFTMFGSGDGAGLKSQIVRLMQTISGSMYPPAATATWHEIQYFILTGTYETDANIQGDANINYWWKTLDEKPVDKPKPWEDFATLTGLIAAVADGSDPDALTNLQAWLTEERALNMGLAQDEFGTPADQGLLDEITWDAMDYDAAGCNDSGAFTITWSQVQNLFINYFYMTGDWTLDDVDTSDMNIADFGIEDPSAGWPSGASLLSMMPNRLMMTAVPTEPVTSTVVGEDGTVTTTESMTMVDEETGHIITTTVTTVVTPQEGGTLVVETTTVNTLDPVTGETSVEILDTQVVFVANEETESPEPAETEEPTESPEPSESPEPEETDLPDPEPPLDPEPTVSPEPTESPEPSETPEPEHREEPDDGEKPSPTPPAEPTQNPEEPEEPDPEPTDPPNVVTTNAALQRRLYRISTRKLKAPPSLRSPNIRQLTTRFVIDRLCVREFILTYGRTPK